MRLMAIDPGNKESAYVILKLYGIYKPDGTLAYEDSNVHIQLFGKEANAHVTERLEAFAFDGANDDYLAIERMESMGMPVGYEVFETCEWIGRYTQLAEGYGLKTDYVCRTEEKITLCGNKKAKDANIRQALIDRFAIFDFKSGKGTKAKPDVFYGFKDDIWQAMAVGTTWLDQQCGTGYKAKRRR